MKAKMSTIADDNNRRDIETYTPIRILKCFCQMSRKSSFWFFCFFLILRDKMTIWLVACKFSISLQFRPRIMSMAIGTNTRIYIFTENHIPQRVNPKRKIGFSMKIFSFILWLKCKTEKPKNQKEEEKFTQE